ncbi:hypothetical protein DIPPA_11922 [Diplonema papillatum]|nr:hypothetical protein DIPPA_11922 [Diplonema papillatum]
MPLAPEHATAHTAASPVPEACKRAGPVSAVAEARAWYTKRKALKAKFPFATDLDLDAAIQDRPNDPESALAELGARLKATAAPLAAHQVLLHTARFATVCVCDAKPPPPPKKNTGG